MLTFSVHVSDAVSSASCEFRLHLLDSNHPPVLVTRELSLPLFSSSNSVVGVILAYDPDVNDTLSYSLLSIVMCWVL